MRDVAPNHELAKRLTDTLRSGLPTLFNPYRDKCEDCERCNGPDAKLARLAAHLACNPLFILCGEAPSCRGCRHSGIAFTSECQLLQGIPRIPPVGHRLTSKNDPYSELSATIVWNALRELRIEERTILWNAVQMHPHEGNGHSNRTPTHEELEIGKAALQLLVREFPLARVIAIGRRAQRSLTKIGIKPPYVRHPANGGATKFANQLKRIVGTESR